MIIFWSIFVGSFWPYSLFAANPCPDPLHKIVKGSAQTQVAELFKDKLKRLTVDGKTPFEVWMNQQTAERLSKIIHHLQLLRDHGHGHFTTPNQTGKYHSGLLELSIGNDLRIFLIRDGDRYILINGHTKTSGSKGGHYPEEDKVIAEAHRLALAYKSTKK